MLFSSKNLARFLLTSFSDVFAINFIGDLTCEKIIHSDFTVIPHMKKSLNPHALRFIPSALDLVMLRFFPVT